MTTHSKLCPKSNGYTDCHCSKPLKSCDCKTKYCKHYESDFDKFVKTNMSPHKPKKEKKLVRVGHYYGHELLIDVTYPLADNSLRVSQITYRAENFIKKAHRLNEIIEDLKELLK